MVSNRKKLIATLAIIAGATGAFALTNPGRAALNRILAPKARATTADAPT